ncbi:MAG TPA: acyl-CoA dehydrogenase family protein [Pseudonocardia sp.]|jgi:acyl-CoA dehydrogenase|nr:acyl-CoA dehydrogenase family protein [Pseudonocardia sp.]
MNTELNETARQVFADHPAQIADGWPAKLWSTLDELGLVRLGLAEDAGGSGGELADVATLLLAAGEAAAPVPLAETELAGWLLHEAGLTVPEGPLAVAIAGEDVRVSDGSVSGSLRRVGWARHATRIAVLATDAGSGSAVVLSVDPAQCELEHGTNVAGEPRDNVTLGGAVESAPAPAGTQELLARRAALLRSLLLAGACGRAVAQSVRYVGERIQFGRPLAKFQAVQQQLALAAAESAAARAAAEGGVRVAAAGGFGGPQAGLAVASAKARSSEAAGTVARIAHQVHGAIGFTLEHELRLSTTRLWSWREEDGSDAHWNSLIGRQALAEGADGLWPLLTS